MSVAADRQEPIRHRASALWEREGRPAGRAAEHWRIAAEEIEEEDRQADRAAATPASAGNAGATARPRRAATRRAPRSTKKG
jgi:hypothetical protein